MTIDVTVRSLEDLNALHGQEHDAEGRDPIAGRLLFVLTVAEVPDTQPAPTIIFVQGPPRELFLVDATGKIKLGFNVEAASTAPVGGDLVTSANTSEATAKDMTGVQVTLPEPGVYVVIGTFDAEYAIADGSADTLVGILRRIDNTVISSPRGAIWAPSNASPFPGQGDRATISQTWAVTTTAQDEVIKLSAYQLPGLAQFRVNSTHTTLAAFSFLGGGGDGAGGGVTSHQDLTGVLSGDHHARYTDAEAAALVTAHTAIVEAHQPQVVAGTGIDVAGSSVSHQVGSGIDSHSIYQLRSEANPGGGYGNDMSREWLVLAMKIDAFQASET